MAQVGAVPGDESDDQVSKGIRFRRQGQGAMNPSPIKDKSLLKVKAGDRSALLSFSRSAEAVGLTGSDHKQSGQRLHRLQARRPCGSRRGGAGDLAYVGNSNKGNYNARKIRVSKSCTKECEILKPDQASEYPCPGGEGYSSLYAEVLNHEDFDLYPHQEVDSELESNDDMSLSGSTLLQGQSDVHSDVHADIYSEASSASCQNSTASSSRSAKFDLASTADNQQSTSSGLQTKGRNGYIKFKNADSTQDGDPARVARPRWSHSLTTPEIGSGRACRPLALQHEERSDVTVTSDDSEVDIHSHRNHDIETVDGSLISDITSTSTRDLENSECKSSGKTTLSSIHAKDRNENLVTLHSQDFGAVADLDIAPKGAEEQCGNTATRVLQQLSNFPSSACRPDMGLSRTARLNSRPSSAPNRAAGWQYFHCNRENRVKSARSSVLEDAELLPVAAKPAICRLEALERAQDSSEKDAGELVRPRTPGRLSNENEACLRKEIEKAVVSALRDEAFGATNGSCDIFQAKQISVQYIGNHTEASELVRGGQSSRDAESDRNSGAGKEIREGSQGIRRDDSPAISILSLNTNTQEPESSKYARRDHNDVIHGDTLVGGLTTDTTGPSTLAGDSTPVSKIASRTDAAASSSGVKSGSRRQFPKSVITSKDGLSSSPSDTKARETPCSSSRDEKINRVATQSQLTKDSAALDAGTSLLRKQTGEYVQGEGRPSKSRKETDSEPSPLKKALINTVKKDSCDSKNQNAVNFEDQTPTSSKIKHSIKFEQEAPASSEVQKSTQFEEEVSRNNKKQQPAKFEQKASTSYKIQTSKESEPGQTDRKQSLNESVPPPLNRSSYLTSKTRGASSKGDALGKVCNTRMPVPQYLSFLQTLRSRSTARKERRSMSNKLAKLDSVHQGHCENTSHGVSSDDNQADAEDNGSTSPACPRGHEIPPGWRPGQHSSNPLTIMSAAYARRHHRKDVKARRRKRRQNLRLYQMWLKKSITDSALKKRKTKLNTLRSKSDSSVSPDRAYLKGDALSISCSDDDEVEDQRPTIGRDNFETKRKYYENLKRQQKKRGLKEGKGDSADPKMKRITSQVTLLKTLDELYNSASSELEDDAESTGEPAKVVASNSDTLKQQMFLLKYYKCKLNRYGNQTHLEAPGMKNNNAYAIRIRKNTSNVPSIITHERLKSLSGDNPGPGDTRTEQPWELDVRYDSEPGKGSAPTGPNPQMSYPASYLPSFLTWKTEPAIEPMMSALKKEAAEIANTASASIQTNVTELQGTLKARAHGECVGESTVQSYNFGYTRSPSTASTRDKQYSTLQEILRQQRCSPDRRSQNARRSKSFDTDTSPSKSSSRLQSARPKLSQQRDREALENQIRGKGKVRFADLPPPIATGHQSWERSEEDTWCYSINAMLLRANKAQQECDFVKGGNYSYPRPDSAKIVSPVVPKSSTFLSELLKQDHMDRKQARTRASKLSKKVEEKLTQIIMNKTEQHRRGGVHVGSIPVTAVNPPKDYPRAQPLPTVPNPPAFKAPPPGPPSPKIPAQVTQADLKSVTGPGKDKSSAGVLKIQVQPSKRSADRAWRTQKAISTETKDVSEQADLEVKTLPKKLVPLRIQKPRDFTNPDNRTLPQNPIREVKAQISNGQPRSATFMAGPVPGPPKTRIETRETNYLLDMYSDTFRYYKNPHMEKRKAAIVQMFADTNTKDSNNNSRAQTDTNAHNPCVPIQQDTLTFPQSRRLETPASPCRSLRKLEQNKPVWTYRPDGMTDQQLDTNTDDRSSSLWFPYSPKGKQTRPEPGQSSEKPSLEDGSPINSVVKFNFPDATQTEGSRWSQGESSVSGYLLQAPCPSELDHSSLWQSSRSTSQVPPTNGVLSSNGKESNSGFQVVDWMRGSRSQARTKPNTTGEIDPDKSYSGTLGQQVFIETLMDYGPGSTGKQAPCKLFQHEDKLQMYARKADVAYRHSVFRRASSTSGSDNYNGVWVPNYEIQDQPENPVCQEKADMNTSQGTVTVDQTENNFTSNQSDRGQSRNEVEGKVTKGYPEGRESRQVVREPEYICPLVHMGGESHSTAAEILQQRLERNPRSPLEEHTDALLGMDMFSVSGLALTLSEKTYPQPRRPSLSPRPNVSSRVPGKKSQKKKQAKNTKPGLKRLGEHDALQHKIETTIRRIVEEKRIENEAKALKANVEEVVETAEQAADHSKENEKQPSVTGSTQTVPDKVTPEIKQESGKDARGVQRKGNETVDILLQSMTEDPWNHDNKEVSFQWEELKVPPPFKTQWDPIEQQQQPQPQESSVPTPGPYIIGSCPSEYSTSTTSINVPNSPDVDSPVECPATQGSNTTEIREDLEGEASPVPKSRVDMPYSPEVCEEGNTTSQVSDGFEGQGGEPEDVLDVTLTEPESDTEDVQSQNQVMAVSGSFVPIPIPGMDKINVEQSYLCPPPPSRDGMCDSVTTRSPSVFSQKLHSSKKPSRSAIDRDYLKKMRGSDILQAIGTDNSRLQDGLQAVTKYSCYIPVFQLRSLEPVEFTPLVLKINHCTSSYTENDWSKTFGSVRSWTVFYSEDTSGYIQSLYTVQWLPCGLYTLHATHDTANPDEQNVGAEVKAGRLQNFSYDGANKAFLSDQVYLFGGEMQTRERALAALVSLNDQLRGNEAHHYFTTLCGWVPTCLCPSRRVCLPPIHQRTIQERTIQESSKTGQSSVSFTGDGQASVTAEGNALHLPEVKVTEPPTTQAQQVPEGVPQLPSIGQNQYETGTKHPGHTTTFLCLRCGDVMDGHVELPGTPPECAHQMVRCHLSDTIPTTALSLDILKIPKPEKPSNKYAANWEITGTGIALRRHTQPMTKKTPQSPRGGLVHRAVKQFPYDLDEGQPISIEQRSQSTTEFNAAKEAQIHAKMVAYNSLIPHARRKSWWDKNRQKLRKHQPQVHASENAKEQVNKASEGTGKPQEEMSGDKDSSKGLHSTPSAPQLTQKKPRNEMAGWDWMTKAEVKPEEEKGLMQKSTWSSPIVPPPYPISAPPTTTPAPPEGLKAKEKQQKNLHKAEYERHRRNLSHISHSYKSPYWTKKEVKRTRTPVSDSDDDRSSISRIDTISALSSSSSSEESSSSESASDESESDSGSSATGSDFFTRYANKGGPTSIDDIFKRTLPRQRLPHSLNVLKEAKEREEKEQLGYLRGREALSPTPEQRDLGPDRSERSATFTLSEYDMCSDAEEIKELWKVCFPEVDFWDRTRKKKFKKTKIWS